MVAYNHTTWQRVFGNPSDSVLLAPATGPAFSLVSRPGGAIGLVENQVFTAAVNIARAALDRAYAILNLVIVGTPPGVGLVPADFDRHFEYCFRVGAAPVASWQTVRDNLVRIRNGLWSPALQIVDKNPNRAGAAVGYVRCAWSEAVRFADEAREVSFAGRIHVRFGSYNAANTAANQNGAASTIAHEATHKFTGARDWAYIGGGSIGWRAMPPGTPLPFGNLTNAQALNNADSYSELAMAMP